MTGVHAASPLLPAFGANAPSTSVRHVASRAGPLPSKVAQQIGDRARQRQQSRLWSLVIGGTAVAGFTIAALNAFQENLMFYITPTQALERFSKEPTKNRFRLGGLVLEGSVKKFVNTTEMEFVVTDLENDILVRYRGALPDLFREGHSIVAEGFLKPMPQDGVTVWDDVTASDSSNKSSTPSLHAVNRPGSSPATAETTSRAQDKTMFPFKEPSSQVQQAKVTATDCGNIDGEDLQSGVEDVAKKARGIGIMFTAMEVLAKHDEKYMPKEVAAVIAENKAKQEQAGETQDAVPLPQPLAQSEAMGAPLAKEKKESRGRKRTVPQTPTEAQAYEVTTS